MGIAEFGAPFVNALQGISRDAFFCPGSILEVKVDPSDTLARGMLEKANVMFTRDQVFKPTAEFRPPKSRPGGPASAEDPAQGPDTRNLQDHVQSANQQRGEIIPRSFELH